MFRLLFCDSVRMFRTQNPTLIVKVYKKYLNIKNSDKKIFTY